MKSFFLFIISLFYSFLIRFVRFVYNTINLFSIPAQGSFIVSVGNISVGGTGKTPMISWLVHKLKKENISCGIVSRGYGRAKNKGLVLLSKESCPQVAGDEPFMLYQEHPDVPIVVGNKKDACFFMQRKFNPNIILVDDGFQSFALKRNLDIVLVDISRPLSDYSILPLGFLREPLKNLCRANVVIFTKSNLNKNGSKVKEHVLKFINPNTTLVLNSSFVSELFLFNKTKGLFLNHSKIEEPVVCFSGIANPESFEKKSLLYCKKIVSTFSFKDHHQYKKTDFKKIYSLMSDSGASSIVTTKKDFWKIKDFFSDYKIYVIDVKHRVENEESLLNLFK